MKCEGVLGGQLLRALMDGVDGGNLPEQGYILYAG